MRTKKQTIKKNRLFCLDPEVGQRLIASLAEPQSEKERTEFEEHLSFCMKCRQELEDLQRSLQQLAFLEHRERFFRTRQQYPLVVTSIFDPGAGRELIEYYHGEPFIHELAAAETSSEIHLLEVQYADGNVIGQFWKRVGHLFYRLKDSTIDWTNSMCKLIHTPTQQTFEFHEKGQELLLGLYEDFVATDTVQGFLNAIKRFDCIVTRKSNEHSGQI